MTEFDIFRAMPYGIIGLVAGLAYFRLLRMSIRLHLDGTSRTRAVVLHAVRIGGAVALFWGLAMVGALPLLFGLAGFVVARSVAVRWRERTP